jgi:hypothetical protein
MKTSGPRREVCRPIGPRCRPTLLASRRGLDARPRPSRPATPDAAHAAQQGHRLNSPLTTHRSHSLADDAYQMPSARRR